MCTISGTQQGTIYFQSHDICHMIGNKNKMAFSKRKIGLNVIAAFIVFKFITAPITDATLTIEEIKAAICAVTDGNYDTMTLSNQKLAGFYFQFAPGLILIIKFNISKDHFNLPTM